VEFVLFLIKDGRRQGEVIMGKLKNLMITEQEQLDKRLYPVLANKDPRISGMQIDDSNIAQFEAEFNAWLDAYEQSFGDNCGK
jgi:hypothetical protein